MFALINKNTGTTTATFTFRKDAATIALANKGQQMINLNKVTPMGRIK